MENIYCHYDLCDKIVQFPFKIHRYQTQTNELYCYYFFFLRYIHSFYVTFEAKY
jgi:hypothetical protein